MRKLATVVAFLLLATPAFAGSRGGYPAPSYGTSAYGTQNTPHVHVNGYTKRDGTYVAPHERTAPNNTRTDNWSAWGNTNPYTGKSGTSNPNSR